MGGGIDSPSQPLPQSATNPPPPLLPADSPCLLQRTCVEGDGRSSIRLAVSLLDQQGFTLLAILIFPKEPIAHLRRG